MFFIFYYLQFYKATNLANLADPFCSSNPTKHSFFTLGLRVGARGFNLKFHKIY